MASIRMDLVVTEHGGQPTPVVAGAADMIALERRFGIGPKDLETAPRLEYLGFLAWSALRRTRPGVPDFDDFIGQLDDIDTGAGPGKAPDDPPAPASP